MANTAQEEKRQAALKALETIKSGMKVGLGTGSTAAFMVRGLGQLYREGRLTELQCVPTSVATRELAQEQGLPILPINEVDRLDITIDGTDEYDADLNLIKGGGGALLREKIVASLSERFIIIADASKTVSQLGAFPLPVEVVPFAWKPVAAKLEKFGVKPVLRASSEAESPYKTDQGNFILDLHTGGIEDLPKMKWLLEGLPGVVEHGLFLDMADEVFLGKEGRVLHITKSV